MLFILDVGLAVDVVEGSGFLLEACWDFLIFVEGWSKQS